MTDTNPMAPTDAELEALIRECRITVTDGQSAYEPWADLRPELTIFARAVLAKWGAQPAAAQPGFALVPITPTEAMVDAAADAYMPFGDMHLAVQMAILAAQQGATDAS